MHPQSENQADGPEPLRDYSDELIADESGMLHADAEEDLRMISEQLRSFNLKDQQRESII